MINGKDENVKKSGRPGLQNIIYFLVGLGAAGVGELTRLPLKEIGIGGLTLLALTLLVRGTNLPTRGKPGAIQQKNEPAEPQGFNLALGRNYALLNQVTGPGGVMEKIVISRAGQVFIVNSRPRACRVEMVNGNLHEDGHAVEMELLNRWHVNSTWVTEKIKELTGAKPPVTGMVVYPDDAVTVTHACQGMALLNRRFAADFILAAPNGPTRNVPLWTRKDTIFHALSRT